jgi:hypothetical protein
MQLVPITTKVDCTKKNNGMNYERGFDYDSGFKGMKTKTNKTKTIQRSWQHRVNKTKTNKTKHNKVYYAQTTNTRGNIHIKDR